MQTKTKKLVAINKVDVGSPSGSRPDTLNILERMLET
jgi:hypothetical protein